MPRFGPCLRPVRFSFKLIMAHNIFTGTGFVIHSCFNFVLNFSQINFRTYLFRHCVIVERDLPGMTLANFYACVCFMMVASAYRNGQSCYVYLT